jgi:chromosome segregation ATPase
MCKFGKIVGIAVIGIVAVALLANTRCGAWVTSHLRTTWDKAMADAEKQVPLEDEIDRLRHETEQLVPDMKKHLGVIAEEMVAVDTLRERIKKNKAEQAQRKQDILTMTADLKSGNERIVYDGREYSANRVKDKLEQDLAAYDRADSELKRLDQVLEAREKSLDAAREQLATMKSKKAELELKLAELEAKVKALRVAQQKSSGSVRLDDSRLSEIEASIAKVENRLKVENKTLELENQYVTDSIPVGKKAKSTNEVIKDVETRFGGGTKADGKVAADRP